MTLVLHASASEVRSLWAVMNVETLDAAKAALKAREDTGTNYIAAWSKGSASPALIANLPQWAESRGVDNVIWTALPAKFNDEDGRVATADEVVAYLGGLTARTREHAERYIRRAPAQIDTPYRRRVEATLGWTPAA